MLDKFRTVRASNGGCINKNCLYVNDYHALQTGSTKEMPKPPYPGLWLLVMWAQIDEPGSLVRCEDFIEARANLPSTSIECNLRQVLLTEVPSW